MPITTQPNSAGQIRTSIREVLLQLQSMIIDATGLDAATVYFTLQEQPPPITAEQSVQIWIRGERPEGQAFDGGGRVNDMRERTVVLRIRSRNRQDEPDRDTSRITSYTLGHLMLEDAVYNAVQLLQEVDNLSRWVITHPQQTWNISGPQIDPQNHDFAISTIELRVFYNRALTQNLVNEGTQY